MFTKNIFLVNMLWISLIQVAQLFFAIFDAY